MHQKHALRDSIDHRFQNIKSQYRPNLKGKSENFLLAKYQHTITERMNIHIIADYER